MDHTRIMMNSFPTEIMLRVASYLPYMSQVALVAAGKKFSEALGSTIRRRTQELKETWRVVKVDEQWNPRRRPIHLTQVVDALIRGDINPAFVEKLICGENLDQSPSQRLDISRVDLEAAFEPMSWLVKDGCKEQYLDMVLNSEENGTLVWALLCLTNLRQIELPADFARVMNVINLRALLRGFANRRHEDIDHDVLKTSLPLQRVEYIFIAPVNNEDGCSLQELYLLFPLPALRILMTQVCNSDESGKPLEPYPSDMPLSKIQCIVFEDCAITTADLQTIVQALGGPCTIHHSWEACYSPLSDDEDIRWASCRIEGHVDPATDLLTDESRAVTIVRADEEGVAEEQSMRMMYTTLKPIWTRYEKGVGSTVQFSD